MIKWEYKVEYPPYNHRQDTPDYYDYTLRHWLEDLGEDGWELSVVVSNYFIFKRPIKGD